MKVSNKENQAFIIGLTVILGGFACLYLLPQKDTAIMTLMAWVLGYYYGSSPGSHGKDQTIGDLAKTALQVSEKDANEPCIDPVEELKRLTAEKK